MARTHVVLSDEVIAAIDERVGERGRSGFLEEAAREKLERLALEAAIRAGAGLLKDEDYLHWRDTESVKEWFVGTARGHDAVLVTHDTADFRCGTSESSIPTRSMSDGGDDLGPRRGADARVTLPWSTEGTPALGRVPLLDALPAHPVVTLGMAIAATGGRSRR